jgi:hypothetical protein
MVTVDFPKETSFPRGIEGWHHRNLRCGCWTYVIHLKFLIFFWGGGGLEWESVPWNVWVAYLRLNWYITVSSLKNPRNFACRPYLRVQHGIINNLNSVSARFFLKRLESYSTENRHKTWRIILRISHRQTEQRYLRTSDFAVATRLLRYFVQDCRVLFRRMYFEGCILFRSSIV